MAVIYRLDEYRRQGMKAGARKTKSTNEQPKGREKAESLRVRMRRDVFEAWGAWASAMSMTYEESVLFLMQQHPIDTRKYAERVAEKIESVLRVKKQS